MTAATYVLGWALVHFIWQGALVALAAASLLALMSRQSAASRYVVACTALAVMLVAPFATAFWLASAVRHDTAGANPTPAAALQFSGHSTDRETASLVARGSTTLSTVRASIDARLPIAVAVWLAGVALFFIRTAGGWWQVRRIHRRSWPVPHSSWQATADRLAGVLGLTHVPRVVDSPLVDTPTVAGWLHPLILLPVAALAQLTPVQVEAVLAHELAHVRRHDYIVNVAQSVAEALLFYHPGIWWLSARIRTEREQCCDDEAVSVSGDAATYVDALASLERWRVHRHQLAVAASGGRLVARVRRLIGAPEACDRSTATAGLAALACALVVVTVWSVHLQGRPARADAQGPEAPRDWTVHETMHFAVYYRDAERQEVDAAAASAELAYRKVSADLRHDLPSPVTIVLFPTRDQIDVGDLPRAAEHIVVPRDTDRTRLDGLLVHELTHVFSFDILPPERMGASVPPWVYEGLSEHERGTWAAGDLTAVRGVAVSNQLPLILNAPDDGTPNELRNHIGHAAFDFIDATHGKNGVRQFLFAIRRSAGGVGRSPYEVALQMTAGDFESALGRYVIDRLR